MTDKNEQKGMSPVKAAIAGAIIGAGVAAAGVVALQDEKKRKKVKAALGSVKDQAVEYLENVQENPDTKKGVRQLKKLHTSSK